MSDERKYLDQEGLAKLWELISSNFIDSTSYDLEIEDLRTAIAEAEAKTDPELTGKVDSLEDSVGALEAAVAGTD